MSQNELKANIEEQKEKRKLNLRIRVTLVINTILVIGLGFYIYSNFTTYSLYKQAIALNQQNLEVLNSNAKSFQSEFQSRSEKINQEINESAQLLDVILPDKENFTELTRQLDNFFFEANQSNPPIQHNNLRFDKPYLSEDQSYFVLPFSMTIQSSKANFEKFLAYVEKSGSISEQSRLMNLQSVQINFIQASESNINEFDISFSVNMLAYFRNNLPQNGQ